MSFENDITSIKKIFEAEKGLFKPASSDDFKARMSSKEKEIRARRANDTWKQRILDFEPGDVDPWITCWFEEMADTDDTDMEDPQARNEYFRSFIEECTEIGLDLRELIEKYLSVDEDTRDETTFFLEVEELLAQAGYYVYNSDTRIEVYRPESMATYDIESEMDESVKEAGLFKPASQDSVDHRHEDLKKQGLAAREELDKLVIPQLDILARNHRIEGVDYSVRQDETEVVCQYTIHIDGKELYLYAWREQPWGWAFCVSTNFQGSRMEFSAEYIADYAERWIIRMKRTTMTKTSPILPESVKEAGLFKPASDDDVSVRNDVAKKAREMHNTARGIKVEYIVAPMPNRDSSFWYNGDVAEITYTHPNGDHRKLILVATGEKRVVFEGSDESYRDDSAVEAAITLELIDDDLQNVADGGKVVAWISSNWFEFYYSSDKWEGERDISVMDGMDVMGTYSEGIELAEDLIADDDMWGDVTSHLEEAAGLFKPATDTDVATRREAMPTGTFFHSGREYSERSNGGVIQRFLRGDIRGKSLSMRIEGNVLYSYATPIAFRHNGLIYCGDVRYSVTTSGKHQGPLRYMAGDRLRRVSGKEFADLLRANGITYLGKLAYHIDEAGLFKPATDTDVEARNSEELKKIGPIVKKRIEKIKKITFPRILRELEASGKIEEVEVSDSMGVNDVRDGTIRVTLSFLFRNTEVHVSANVAVRDSYHNYTRYSIEVDTDSGYQSFQVETVSGAIRHIIRLVRKYDTDTAMPHIHAKSKEAKRNTSGAIKNAEDLGHKYMAGDVSGRITNACIVGDVLYSYATPIAIRQNGRVYVVDKKFSVTTNRLQSTLRGAILTPIDAFKAKLAEVGITDIGYLGEAGLFKPASDDDVNNRPAPQPWPEKFIPYIGKKISITCREYCRPEEPLVGVVVHDTWIGYHSQLKLLVDGYGGKAKHFLNETDDVAEVLEEAGLFKPASDDEVDNRNNTPAGKRDPVQLALDLHRAGFTDGVDVSPEISLLEYGILRNPATNKVVFCVHLSDENYHFDTSTISYEDILEALEGISDKFYDMLGVSVEEYKGWLTKSPKHLSSLINDINMYNGYFTESNTWDDSVISIRNRILGENLGESLCMKTSARTVGLI